MPNTEQTFLKEEARLPDWPKKPLPCSSKSWMRPPLRKEIAFYDALANNESALRELGDETLKKIAHELTEKLRASTTIDWQVRDNVRARIRNMIRRLLKKYKYPPDRQAEAIDLILRQAEKLSCAWAA